MVVKIGLSHWERNVGWGCLRIGCWVRYLALRNEITGEWCTLLTERLNYLYSSLNIIRVIKSRTMRWVGHVARMGQTRVAYRVLMRKPEGRKHLEDPGVDWRMILKWIFKKWDVGHGVDPYGSEKGQKAGTCKYGNEPSRSIKCGEFLD
jgi:hypothetical protein